jgi:hypothetical protein
LVADETFVGFVRVNASDAVSGEEFDEIVFRRDR